MILMLQHHSQCNLNKLMILNHRCLFLLEDNLNRKVDMANLNRAITGNHNKVVMDSLNKPMDSSQISQFMVDMVSKVQVMALPILPQI